MRKKIECLKNHVDEINKILSENSDCFYAGVPNIVRFKEILFQKGVYEIQHDSLFLKSEHKEIVPYIKIQETWKSDEMIAYTYQFEIPSVEYCFACRGSDKAAGYKTFSFRYESHLDRTDEKYPKYHLHVLDNVPPHYHVHLIEFQDFFNIIKNDFLNDSNLIVFKY